MFIAFKALGATCLAGALATSGMVTGDHLIGQRDKDDGASATVTADPHAILEIPTTTTTEPPTTTTTETPAPPPPVAAPVTLAAPVQPTVVPVAGAGSVVIVLQGPVIVIKKVNVIAGWIADVERRSGDVNVVFRKGDRSFRFLASFKDRRLLSDIREIRADGDRTIRADAFRDGDHWDDGHWDGDRRGDGDRDWWSGRH